MTRPGQSRPAEVPIAAPERRTRFARLALGMLGLFWVAVLLLLMR